MSLLKIRTTWGEIEVTAEAGRITSCKLPFVARRPAKPFRATGSRIDADNEADHETLAQADRFVRDLFDGSTVRLPKVKAPEAAPFLAKAWKAIMTIPPGRAITYGELARKAGSPKAVRAAGQACAKNRIPLFIPCHRILGAGGRLGGFSCGLPWKELLLEREGTIVSTKS
ncbi:MAG: MGMT family protein [bacterium]